MNALLLALSLITSAAPSTTTPGFTLTMTSKALERAGVKVGDKLVAVDGCPVVSPLDLQRGMTVLGKKGKHTVEIERDGALLVSVTDEKGAGAPSAAPADFARPACAEAATGTTTPTTTTTTTTTSAPKDMVVPAYDAGKAIGLKLVKLQESSPFAHAGLVTGDIVTRIGGCLLTKERYPLTERLRVRPATEPSVLVEGSRKGVAVAYVSPSLDKPAVAKTDLPVVDGDRPECVAFLAVK